MNNIDIGKLLRIIDRRILIMIIVGIVGIVGVQRFFVASTSSSLVSATAERVELQNTTESLETRVDEILSDGTISIDAIVTRIGSMETTLPTEIDDLEFSAEIYRLAEQGVLIENIAIADTPEQKPGGVRYVLYQVSGKSPFGSLSQFVSRLGVTGTYVTTVTDISISQDTRSSSVANTETRPLASGDNNTKFIVTLMVWFDDTERLIIGAETDADTSDAAAGQEAGQAQGTGTGQQQGAPQGGNNGTSGTGNQGNSANGNATVNNGTANNGTANNGTANNGTANNGTANNGTTGTGTNPPN